MVVVRVMVMKTDANDSESDDGFGGESFKLVDNDEDDDAVESPINGKY